MPEPITTGTVLTFVGSAIVSGVLGNRSDAGFKSRWEKFQNNLKQHRPDANHELATAAYRSYLQATLQTCVVLLERHNLKVDGWFKLSVLPEKIARAMRSVLSEAPAGVFTQADKKWLEAVSLDHFSKLKQLEKSQLEIPLEYEHQEFSALLAEIEVLMQPEEAREREQLIREALVTRVLNDLESQFDEPPAGFKDLVNERWFEFLCAGFQYHIKHQQEIANAFEGRLIAKLVARSEWQQQLVHLAEQVPEVIKDEGKRIRTHFDQHFGELRADIQGMKLQVSSDPEPLIHTLPTHQEIEGRTEESATIIRAMSESKQRVLAFAAPGGFGKTALLAKVVQEVSSDDGKSLIERVSLPNGETIDTKVETLLHIDCRNGVNLSALFANAGRLIGQQQTFQDIYNSEANLPDKLQKIFGRLSTNPQKRTWFVFDNCEPLLNEAGEIADPALGDFFSAFLAGGHSVHALVSAREVPKFSPREQILELTAVGGSLFEGLPLDDCLAYLKKNGAAQGLGNGDEKINAVLKKFARRVHQIPLALVWAIGYLRQTNYTLKAVLEREDLFADFERDQTKDDQRYENKGLKRLHYEQLKIQTGDSIPILRLLAFFKRPVPKGALAHVLGEIELNKVLTRLERNKLLSHRESADAYTRYLNDDLAVNLYGLHPVICENQFFDTLPDKESLYETAASACGVRANSAYKVNRFAYATELLNCAEKLYEYLTKAGTRSDLLNSYAGMLVNKGVALDSLTRLIEAVAEYDKAIAIFEHLVNVEQQSHLSNNLANTYSNKGVALGSLTKFTEAVAEFDKAIAIIERLVNVEQQSHMVHDLAKACMNKGVALASLTKFTEAVAEYDKAISTIERLVNVEQQSHMANYLAMAYMNKGVALDSLTRFTEAVAEYDKAIAIRERLVNIEQHAHLANDLAMTYMNKGVALRRLTRLTEAMAEYDKAIAIYESLVNVEQQAQLTNYLAMVYFNKAVILEHQEDTESALSCYKESLQARTLCVERLNMFWVMPELLETLRYRLMTLLDLERWPLAAKDVLWFLSMYEPYAGSDAIDDGLKHSATFEFAQMISRLHRLTTEQRELVYAELGEKAKMVRSHVSESERE